MGKEEEDDKGGRKWEGGVEFTCVYLQKVFVSQNDDVDDKVGSGGGGGGGSVHFCLPAAKYLRIMMWMTKGEVRERGRGRVQLTSVCLQQSVSQ